MILTKKQLIIAGALASLAACEARDPGENAIAEGEGNATANAAASNDPIQSAMSAAPAALASRAAIVTIGSDGAMQTVREGSNGWTCLPDNPATPGPDPMCMDDNAMRWIGAWIKREPPPADAVGLAYMLSGGTDASNTDPHAQAPSEGNNWIETGPHIMIMGSPEILADYPSDPKPDTKAPYVMWAGTPYAHLMVPVDKS